MKAMIAKVNHFHAIILSPNRNAQPQYYRGFADFPKKFQKILQKVLDSTQPTVLT